MNKTINGVELEAFARFLGADVFREEGYLEVYVNNKTFQFEEKEKYTSTQHMNYWVLSVSHTGTEIYFTHARCRIKDDFGWLNLYNEGVYIGKLNLKTK